MKAHKKCDQEMDVDHVQKTGDVDMAAADDQSTGPSLHKFHQWPAGELE